jgi:hypothetical protein
MVISIGKHLPLYVRRWDPYGIFRPPAYLHAAINGNKQTRRLCCLNKGVCCTIADNNSEYSA